MMTSNESGSGFQLGELSSRQLILTAQWIQENSSFCPEQNALAQRNYVAPIWQVLGHKRPHELQMSLKNMLCYQPITSLKNTHSYTVIVGCVEIIHKGTTPTAAIEKQWDGMKVPHYHSQQDPGFFVFCFAGGRDAYMSCVYGSV